MPRRSEADFLQQLRARGARRLRRVSFRRNRRTIWSLTRRGTALNVHAAYREAPDELLDAFALLARRGGRGGPEVDRARRLVRGWVGVGEALRRIREEHARAGGDAGRIPCAGTPEQRGWLRALYAQVNAGRFQGALPGELPLRLSRRMRSRLGHMRPGAGPGGERRVVEIALNLDLLLPGNEEALLDTLLHEMAHAAAWIFDGERGHGAPWRRRAEAVGCVPRTRHQGAFRRRRRRGDPVTRVPPYPEPPGGPR